MLRVTSNVLFEAASWKPNNHFHRPGAFRRQVDTIMLLHRFCTSSMWYLLPIELIWEICAALWQVTHSRPSLALE